MNSGKHEEALNALEEKLGYRFQSRELLSYALTHRSAAGKESRNDYERLEFLGDAVLDLIVADLLLLAHPEAREGELSKMRAAIVNTESLADSARELDLGSCIVVSKAERAQNGHERPSILADVMESLVGAIYREAGFDRVREVISQLFGSKVLHVEPTDPKTELQEVLHALGSTPPEYLLEYVEGPEHAPNFVSIVKVDGEIVGRGEGRTKKASQQEAARMALGRFADSQAEKTPDLNSAKTHETETNKAETNDSAQDSKHSSEAADPAPPQEDAL